MKTDMKTQDFLQLYLDKVVELWYDNRAQKKLSYAGMAELADALDSGSSEGSFMQVQLLLPAPKQDYNINKVLESCFYSRQRSIVHKR